MKNLALCLALVCVLSSLVASTPAYGVGGMVIDIGFDQNGAVTVTVDWEGDGIWDETFHFANLEEAQVFLEGKQ